MAAKGRERRSAAAHLLQWMQGMDVSKNQSVDWSQLDTEVIKFAMIKATDGINYVDPKFNSNWMAAGQLNTIKRGAYHFFRPDDAVDDQIRLIRETVILNPNDFQMVINVENTRNRKLTAAGPVDLDRFNGSFEGLLRLASLS